MITRRRATGKAIVPTQAAQGEAGLLPAWQAEAPSPSHIHSRNKAVRASGERRRGAAAGHHHAGRGRGGGPAHRRDEGVLLLSHPQPAEPGVRGVPAHGLGQGHALQPARRAPRPLRQPEVSEPVGREPQRWQAAHRRADQRRVSVPAAQSEPRQAGLSVPREGEGSGRVQRAACACVAVTSPAAGEPGDRGPVEDESRRGRVPILRGTADRTVLGAGAVAVQPDSQREESRGAGAGPARGCGGRGPRVEPSGGVRRGAQPLQRAQRDSQSTRHA